MNNGSARGTFTTGIGVYASCFDAIFDVVRSISQDCQNSKNQV